MEGEQPKIVDTRGKEIRLNSYQKNEIYRKAKEMRSQLKDQMCTRRETRNPTDQNVQKMLNSEFKVQGKMDTYIKSMQAIGADPKDCDVDRIRRR